jgi:hypothetical protein
LKREHGVAHVRGDLRVETVHLGGRQVLDGRQVRRGVRSLRRYKDASVVVVVPTTTTDTAARLRKVVLVVLVVRAARSALRVQLSERGPERAGIAPDRFAETASSLRLPRLPHLSHRVPRERLLDGDHRLQRARRDGRRRRQLHRQASGRFERARGVGQVPVREAPAPGDLVEGGAGDGLQRAHEIGVEESRGQNHENSARVRG